MIPVYQESPIPVLPKEFVSPDPLVCSSVHIHFCKSNIFDQIGIHWDLWGSDTATVSIAPFIAAYPNISIHIPNSNTTQLP